MLRNSLTSGSSHYPHEVPPVRFKIDENLPIEVSALLREAGHDAVTVLDEELGGCPDSDIAVVCKSEHRVLITLDTDFSNIRAYPPNEFCGIIVLRLTEQAKPGILGIIPRVISALNTEALDQSLWVVETDRIRIRGPE